MPFAAGECVPALKAGLTLRVLPALGEVQGLYQADDRGS